MKNRYSLFIVSIFLFTFSFEAIADINMGIFPRRPVAATVKLFKPLAKKLSEELGEPVHIKVSKNFKKFWGEVKKGEYDIIHLNQYQYLLAKKEKGYRVIAVNEEFGSNKIAGALSVRKDSGIKSIEDMRGKTILFGGGKKAMGSYIAPTYMLKKAGLVAGQDYKVKFAKNPVSAVISTFNKHSDVAGSGDVILRIKAVKKKVDTSQMEIVVKSEPFIHLPWAVSKDMSDDKMAKIQSVMTSLKGSDDAVLKSAKVTNFVKASDADFGKVREIVEAVTGEKL